jgi:hypothetical protein
MTNIEKPRAKPGMTCPLWRRDMSKVCHTCEWWICVTGKNPQSEEIVNEWGCAIKWLPMLTVENSQMQRQTGAAVESFRNEMVKFNQLNLNALVRDAALNLLADGRKKDEIDDHRAR